MTGFDWILLIVGGPWALWNSLLLLYMNMVYMGLFKVNFGFYIPYGMILLLVYRLWG